MSPAILNALIWGGALVTVVGLAGIILSIWRVQSARKAGLSDDALRTRLQQLVVLNIGAFLISALGLMMVAFGIMLG